MPARNASAEPFDGVYPTPDGGEYASVSFEDVSTWPARVVQRITQDSSTPFRVVVAGSRSIRDEDAVRRVLESSPMQWRDRTPAEMVTGGADGVDSISMEVARDEASRWDSLSVFEPEWGQYGPQAGPLRNEEMATYGDALIAIWDGNSSGTENMIETALDAGIPVYVEKV